MKIVRVGTFTISRDIIENKPEEARRILAGVIVLRAEFIWEREAVQYWGACDAFRQIHEHEEAPRYLPSLSDGPVAWTEVKR